MINNDYNLYVAVIWFSIIAAMVFWYSLTNSLKDNMSTKLKELFTLSLLIGYLIFIGVVVTSCGSDQINTNKSNPEEPVLPCVGSFYEYEPNDILDDANAVALLPTAGADKICGRFDGTEDCFYFALNPVSSPVGKVTTNWVLETHSDLFVQLQFYQSIYDSEGTVIGYEFLGIFSGGSGSVIITDFDVEYEFPYTSDLLVKVTGHSVLPNETYKYELDFWAY